MGQHYEWAVADHVDVQRVEEGTTLGENIVDRGIAVVITYGDGAFVIEGTPHAIHHLAARIVAAISTPAEQDGV